MFTYDKIDTSNEAFIQDKAEVIKRECDESMARHKGYMPCDRNCLNCFACIETNSEGERYHVYKKEEGKEE